MSSVKTFFAICLSSFVLAACGGGSGGGSGNGVTPDTSAPTVPQSLSATASSNTQITLSWSASTDIGGGSVAGYRIYRDGSQVGSVTTGTGYSDTGLTANTTYGYSISAYDDGVPANESAQSSPAVSVTTLASPDSSPPGIPQNLSANAVGSTSVNLGWSASIDAGGGSVAGYRLYRGGVLVASVTSGTSYADTGLTANTNYSYSVSAYDNAVPVNESAQSSPSVSVTTPPLLDTLPPGVPQNLSATVVSEVRVDLAWSASADNGGGAVAGYRVYRGGVLVTSVTSGTSYSDTGLTASTSYSYTVSAYDNATPANESAQSSPPVNATTLDTSAPTVPQGLNAGAVSETRVDLSWNASTDNGGGSVAGYRVYRDGVLVTLVSVTSYSDTALSGNTAYSYTVSAYDDAVPANESAQSSPPVNVTTPDTTPPTVPQNLSALAANETQVDLSWSASTDGGGGSVAGYRVYRDSALIATVTAGLSYSDSGLTASTAYSYSVSAFDGAVPANESALSSPSVTVTTLDTSAPTVPLNLTANAVSPTQVNLGWSISTDNGGGSVAGYKVYQGGVLINVVTANRYSDTGLTANTAYSYSVSAFDDAVPANNSAQSSPAVNVTTPVDPGLPVSYDFTNPDVSAWMQVDDSGIASTWQVISGEYHQSTDVGDGAIGVPLDQSYKLGTYSYLTGLTTMTGYRFSVDITPLKDAPPRDDFDGQDVGVMFRYQNNNNYYRVSFSAQESFARLEKKVGGVFTTLAVNARGYIDEQLFNLSVNLSGDLIQVTVSGDPVFAVSDPDLSSGTIALYSQDAVKFDNVLIDVSDPAPGLVVSTPLAHSVQLGNAVTGSAAVTNIPVGGSVDFDFAGVPCAVATETPPGSGFYTADCGTPVQGDYFLAGQGLRGFLRNSSSGVVASDENLRVGIQGDNYITVGDSLTLGTFDFYSADNQSLDGRIIGQQGFQARLNDLLTASTAVPVQIFNEGVGGDKTTNTLTRINSILERHPGSNKVLMMLGTNDSSGATPLSQSAYQTNMQSLVNTLTGQGKTVWVAKLPSVLPLAANATRNTDIQGYNTAIDSLTGISPGPDFFPFFYDDNGTPGVTSDDYERLSLYYDKLHPNALGQRIFSDMWDNALSASATVSFYLDRLCNRLVSAACNTVSPTNHKQNLLEVGNLAYIDETFTLTFIPAALADGIWIQTANSENGNTGGTYIDFTVDRPVTVYVAYDAGAVSLPDWLNPATSSYVDTALNVLTTDPLTPSLRVYSQGFAAGAIGLSGNLAASASGADSNYLVVVVQ